jgi:predicted NBD/HSP70 family sugar kinase
MPRTHALRADHVVILREFLTHELRSRADLATATGWARNTVAQRLNELADAGWVVESDVVAQEGRGRPTARFRLRVESVLVFVASFGQDQLHGALVTLNGTIVATETVAFSVRQGPEACVAAGRSLFDRLREQAEVPASSVAIGVVGVASPVDEEHHAINPIVLPGWHRFDLAAEFGEELGMRVLVENDANLMALGIAAGDPDAEAVVFVKIAGGVGAGSVAHGRLIRGLRGLAGEIGHTPITRAMQLQCPCGNRGCLGEIAAVPAIIRDLVRQGYDISTLDDLQALALGGDAVVIGALRQAGRDVGEALIGLATALAPERIVFGGRITQFGDHVVTGVRETLYTRALPALTSRISIETAPDHEQCAMVGAAVVAREHLLATPR